MLQNTRANNCECFVGFVLLPPVQQVAPSPSPLSPSSFISIPSPSISLPLTSSSPSISFPLYLPPPSLSLPFHPSSPPFPSPSISLSLISIPSPPFPSPSTSIFSFPLHLSRKGVDDQLKFLRLRITGIPFIRNTHHTEYLWATKSESLLTPFIRDTCTHHNDMQWEPKSETPPNIYHQMYPPPTPPSLSVVLTWLLAPGPGVDERLGLFWLVQILLVLLSLLLIQLLTMETTAAIIWSTVSVTATAGQNFHSTVVLPCLP